MLTVFQRSTQGTLAKAVKIEERLQDAIDSQSPSFQHAYGH